jgi:hypothetical protein
VRGQNFSGRPIACHPSSRPGNQGSVGIASSGCQRLPLPSRPWTTWTRFSGSCSRGLIRTRPVFRSRCDPGRGRCRRSGSPQLTGPAGRDPAAPAIGSLVCGSDRKPRKGPEMSVPRNILR